MRGAVLFSGLALLLAGCGSAAGGATTTTAAPAPPSSSAPVSSSAEPAVKDLATFMPSDAEAAGERMRCRPAVGRSGEAW